MNSSSVYYNQPTSERHPRKIIISFNCFKAFRGLQMEGRRGRGKEAGEKRGGRGVGREGGNVVCLPPTFE